MDSSTAPNLEFRESIQSTIAALPELKRPNQCKVLKKTFKRFKDYAKGGNLESCYPSLVELFRNTALLKISVNDQNEETQHCFDILESEELLLAVLANPEFRSSEANQSFDFPLIRLIMRTFQFHCSKISPSPDVVSRKVLWKGILHQVYLKFFNHREAIYKLLVDFLQHLSKSSNNTKAVNQQIKYMLYARQTQLSEEESEQNYLGVFYGASCILEVLGAIIQGFNTPLKPIHVELLLKSSLLPLHVNALIRGDTAGPALEIYHQPLSFCVAEFCKKDQLLVQKVVTQFLRQIPVMLTKGQSKQVVLILNECEVLFEMMTNAQFLEIKRSFFSVIGLCCDNLNFAVVQRSLLLLTSPVLIKFLGLVQKDFENEIAPLLLRVGGEHWNDSSKQMSFQALLAFIREYPSSSISRMRAFRTLEADFLARFASEEEQEQLKLKRMSERKTGLSLMQFVFMSKLGEGSYSVVHNVRRINHGVSQVYWEDYALKVMDIDLLREQNYYENALQEISLLENQLRDHSNIIQLLGTWEEGNKIYLLLEFAQRGDLFHVLERLGTVDENYGRFVMTEMCLALQYIHKHGFAHLDLKPENILIFHDGRLKLTDFGSAVNLHYETLNTKNSNIDPSSENFKLQGTAEYLSPSLLDKERPVVEDDVWALGCMLFQLFSGTTPFNGHSQEKLFRAIKERNVVFPPTFPPLAKDLVEMILCIGREYRRVTLDEVIDHKFFDGVDWANIHSSSAPVPLEGSIKATSIDVNLRQRKYSMLFTQALPRKYQFTSFDLDPIPESNPESTK